ncbi:MAG: diacylglycerol kinase family protein [Candidatus Peregrinibacteria bacterium]|nr:diacylglycerol kinase family protein [Candidatus Peregrinibacteria bacterium]MDZ4244694.1 diacylglycerol kinase family protein [Candidatus Gracilibacteria bacterium]
MKKVLVIYNPISGAKARRDVEGILKDEIEKNGYSYTWFGTLPRPKQPLEKLFKESFHRIIVVGGDGTVAEVADFLIQQKIKTPMVIVPRGTANLLAITLGISLISVRRAVSMGLQQNGRPIDAMHVNKKHYALTAIGKGYDAFVMKNTTRAAKKRWGLLAYIYTFAKHYFFHRSHAYDLTIDGKKHHTIAKSIVVFNALPIPIVKIGGKVNPNDGLLNIAIFNPRLFRATTLATFTGKNITIHSDEDCEFDLDGELIHGHTVSIEVIKSALNIVYTKKF